METIYELETFTVKLAVSEPVMEHAGSSEEAVEILRPIYAQLDADQEHFLLLFLNGKNKIRGYKVVSTGDISSSLIHPAIVFRAVLLFGAVAFIAAHNHPSGDPEPSEADRKITRRLVDCAETFGIRFLDHVILGDGRYFSFSNRGMMQGEDSKIAAAAAAWRADHGIPPIGSPTGKGGRHRGAYKDRKAKRRDAGIPRGPRIKQAVVPEPPAAS
jgi:DNA repair protein RadC